MLPTRPWVLLGIPLAAELARISAGVYFDFGTFSSTLLLSGALAGLLWRLGRVKAAKKPAPATLATAPSPVANDRAETPEIESLRRERDRLRTVLDWHERLARIIHERAGEQQVIATPESGRYSR